MLADKYRHFRGNYCLHLPRERVGLEGRNGKTTARKQTGLGTGEKKKCAVN
jgi:hypothetical protein